MEPDHIRPTRTDDNGKFVEWPARYHELLHVAPKLQLHRLNTSDNNDTLQATVGTATVGNHEWPGRELLASVSAGNDHR